MFCYKIRTEKNGSTPWFCQSSMFLGCESSLFKRSTCFQKILISFQCLNNLCVTGMKGRNCETEILLQSYFLQGLSFFDRLFLPAFAKNNLLNANCCYELCISWYIIPLLLKFRVANHNRRDKQLVNHKSLCLKSRNCVVGLTGYLRDKFTVEKGEGFLCLSLLLCFTDTARSSLFCFVGGEVNAEKQQTQIKMHHLSVTTFHYLQIGNSL